MGFIDNLTQLQIANLQGEALHTNRSEYPSPGSRSWFGSPGSRHSLPSHLGRCGALARAQSSMKRPMNTGWYAHDAGSSIHDHQSTHIS